MTKQERSKLDIMYRLHRGEVSRRQAASILEITERQVYRLYQRFKEQGDRGIVHRSRGGHSGRLLSLELRNEVLRLYHTSYRDYGPTLFCEVLASDHGMRLHPETVRRWAIDAGLWQRALQGRRSRKHRKARPRRQSFGAMIQLDGSEHDWFEGRLCDANTGKEISPMTTLLVIVDDATGMTMLRFASEDTTGVFGLLRDYMLRFGVPQSIYTDHGAVYGVASTDETQYRRALRELGIERIQAHSPQAKGRVERANRTLQDRLTKALRRVNISSIEEANRFLDEQFTPDYNKRFAKGYQAIARENNVHRQTPEFALLERILAIDVKRTIRNDYTIVFGRQTYQIDKPCIKDTYLLPVPGAQVTLRAYLDGSLWLFAGDPLAARRIPLRPVEHNKLKIPGRTKTRDKTQHIELKLADKAVQYYATRNP